MKSEYWLARDKDGTPSLWGKKPERLNTDTIWEGDNETVLIADGEDDVAIVIGNGFYGVRKGQCKRIMVTRIVEVV